MDTSVLFLKISSFCGDTLFTGGCGYLFDGPPEKMHRSLMRLSSCQLTRRYAVRMSIRLTIWFAYSIDPDNDALIQRITETQLAYQNKTTVVPSTLAQKSQPILFENPSRSHSNSSRGTVSQSRQSKSIESFAAIRKLKDKTVSPASPSATGPLNE